EQARDVFRGTPEWERLDADASVVFPWDPDSTYLRPQPYFDGGGPARMPRLQVRHARALRILGDDVTTDQISPAGAIPASSLAAEHLRAHGVTPAEFN